MQRTDDHPLTPAGELEHDSSRPETYVADVAGISGLAVKHALGRPEGPFRRLESGIASGKWSTAALALESFGRGDERMLGAIARYLVSTNSLLEMSDNNFLFPQVGPDGHMEFVPFMDWRYTLDELTLNPELWSKLQTMRSDLTPDKWPIGGAQYKSVYAKAGFDTLPSGQPNDEAGKTRTFPEFRIEFCASDGGLRPRKYLAQKLETISTTFLDDIQKGGNSLLTHHNEIIQWAETGRYGEGRSRLPAREMARLYADLSRTENGRSKLSPLLASPAYQQAIDKALRVSGFTYFTDIFGRRHDLTVNNLLQVGVEADREVQGMHSRGEEVPPLKPLELGSDSAL